MTTVEALAGLGSLAQETRLTVFRLLVQRGPEGLAAGAIAEALEVPASSLSFHLRQLMHAGLVTQERRSRQLIYAANYERMNALLSYLTENCCGAASGAPVALGQCRPEGRPVKMRAAARGRR
ncbi:MAG TPA: metalloregulator ArsR/SmtB family transcription factor [Myxococcaceae bacterium]|nr:metalloregulator ArsR/SmtB family transcription factor [Myxococcaceae bacterium]